MAPPSAEMIVKSVALSIFAIVVIIALSAWISRPSASKKGSVQFAPFIMIAYFCLALSFGVPIATLAKSVGGPTLGRVFGPLGFLSGIWFAAIVIQVAQNVGYRLVGAPTQKIQWYRSWKKQSKRNKSARARVKRGR